MKFDNNPELLTVYFEDRIDSGNAGRVEEELNEIRTANAHTAIVIDVENLQYISSAGLRVVLRTRKAEPSLKIIHASPEVFEVFEMTGFSEMIPIEKAYRRLSVDGCEVIGQGANGKVYRLDPDTIIKVYFNPNALPEIHNERELARKAFVKGIPTAIPYDVVKVGEGYGSVFELLNAKSFSKLIAEEPENLDKYVNLYVDLLKQIHSTELSKGEMPDMKKVVVGWAEFLKDHIPADQYEKLIKLVNEVPDNNHMLHGDYHTKNVMLQNGEVLLIDMDTLCLGDPVFEFASIFLAYVGFCELDHDNILNFLGFPFEVGGQIWEKTLRLYFGTEDEKKINDIKDKAMLIGYTRLLRRTIRRIGYDDPMGKAIIDNAKAKIAEILTRVDSLSLANI